MGVINYSLIGRSNDKTTISESFKINNNNITHPDIIANEFCNFCTNIGIKYANEIPNSKFTCQNNMHHKKNEIICLWPQLMHMKS